MPLGKTLETLMAKQRFASPYCSYQTLYNTLSDSDKKALDNAWAMKLPVSVILRAIKQEGHKLGKESITAHSKGQCKCPK